MYQQPGIILLREGTAPWVRTIVRPVSNLLTRRVCYAIASANMFT